MGTISSVSKEIKYNKKGDSQDESSEYEIKTLNSSKTINKKNQSQLQSETRENTKDTNLNEQKIQFKFEWKDGGNDVKITGAFLDNWTKKIDMKRNISTGIYEIILNIPKGIHQFKFIVDNQWVCSKYYKIINDSHNNINNIIDTSNIPSQIMDKNDNNNSSIKKKKKKEHIDYNCYFPNSNEINVEAPGIPMHFMPCFNLNFQTKQDFLDNYFKKSLFINKSKSILENETFKTIITISHEKLSHICFNNESNDNDKYIRTSITQRNKHKFLTLVYYSPKK